MSLAHPCSWNKACIFCFYFLQQINFLRGGGGSVQMSRVQEVTQHLVTMSHTIVCKGEADVMSTDALVEKSKSKRSDSEVHAGEMCYFIGLL